MPDIQSEYVELIGCRWQRDAGLVLPAAEPETRAGLLVFQEAFGVNAHIRD